MIKRIYSKVEENRYVSPQIESLEFENEGVLCGSTDGDNDPFVDGGIVDIP